VTFRQAVQLTIRGKPMAPFRTAFNGYAVKFSPFEETRIAVATAQNFGIIGNGRQYVLQVRSHTHKHSFVCVPTFVLDACWHDLIGSLCSSNCHIL